MKKHKLLPKVTENLLAWEDVVEILGFYCHHDMLHGASTGEKSDPNKCDYFYTLSLLDIPIHMPHKVEHVYETLSLVKENKKRLDDNYTPSMALYMSFAPYALSHGIHRDVTDVYHWQQLGTTRWVVYDNGKHTYDLTPGDVLFIPKGMYHDTLPLTPRAGLSLGWLPPKYKIDEGMKYLQSETTYYDKPDDKSLHSIFNLK